MVMTIARDGGLLESTRPNIVPKERYVSQEFFDLEMEKLWPQVWQMACREEEIPRVGRLPRIHDRGPVDPRRAAAADTIKAFYNTCPHRGTRLATGTGNFATSEIRCRYHAWRWDLDGPNTEVVDRDDFPPTMTTTRLGLSDVLVGRWGGFVFVNMDLDCRAARSNSSAPPQRLAPYRLEKLRFRSYRTTILPANWKSCSTPSTRATTCRAPIPSC